MKMPGRRSALAVPALGAILLLAILALSGTGQTLPVAPGGTPTVYAHLPLIARPATAATAIPPDDLQNEEAILAQINQLRSANGLSALNMVSELTQAARRHCRDMADNNFTSHTGSDDSNAGQRMQEAGYDWSTWGEIIGWGFGGDPDRMVEWWVNSPTHYSTILSGDYEDIGVGYAWNVDSEWGNYWTVNFGRRAAAAATATQHLTVCTYTAQGQLGGSRLMVAISEPCQKD